MTMRIFGSLLQRGAGVARAVRGGRLLASLGLLPMLASCMQGGGQGAAHAPLQALPDQQVIDFRVAACETLWDLEGKESIENALYWLRAIDCADRLGPAEAQRLGQSMVVDSWESAFRQSILLSSADPTPAGRRQLLTRVNQYRAEMPGSLRPLVQLWRERQNLEIVLNEERAKAQRAQEANASQIAALHQAQALLQDKLSDTQQKLENLTDIERRLSSRKQLQGELPEGGEGHRRVDPDETYTPPAAGDH